MVDKTKLPDNELTMIPGRYEVQPLAPAAKEVPQAFSSSTLEESARTRRILLERILRGVGPSTELDRQLRQELFNHAQEAEAHSPLLQPHAHIKAAEETLVDKVRRIVGRR